MEKLCLFCKNFYFNPGEKGYSDMTPGYDTTLGCNLGYWDILNIDAEESYRECQLKAKTCKDFQQIDLENIK
jgi:hypothetical protein